jgi:hypothetical protein
MKPHPEPEDILTAACFLFLLVAGLVLWVVFIR